MNREQLAHVLRAVSRITHDRDVLVIGSQSILGSYPAEELPAEATGSMEVDTAFFADPDGVKSDLVDGAIGELSSFHDRYGYYPQGVSVNTGKFPAGWEDRLVVYHTQDTEPGRGLCLEPHDCVLRKLVRFEKKDQDFAVALVEAESIDLDTLADRVRTLPVDPVIINRIQDWIAGMKVRQHDA